VRPLPGSRPAVAAAGERPKVPDHVLMIAVLSAATAVMFLVLLTQTAAVIANPHGRDSLNLILAQAGVPPAQRPGVLVLYEAALVLFSLLPALLHGAAFYGLMQLRRAGWMVAFLLSVVWSLALVGIPFAYLLWRRDTRAAFGIS
jgi:hypothetical protein